MTDLPERVRKRLESVEIRIGQCGYTSCGQKYGGSSRHMIDTNGNIVVILEKECRGDGIQLLSEVIQIEKPILEGSNIEYYLDANEVLTARYYDFPKIRRVLNRRCSEGV